MSHTPCICNPTIEKHCLYRREISCICALTSSISAEMSSFITYIKGYLQEATVQAEDIIIHTGISPRPAIHNTFKLEDFQDLGIVLGETPNCIVRGCKWRGRLVAVKLQRVQDEFISGCSTFSAAPLQTPSIFEGNTDIGTPVFGVEELLTAHWATASEARTGTTYTYCHENLLSTRGALVANPALCTACPALAARLKETNDSKILALGVVMEAATSGSVYDFLSCFDGFLHIAPGEQSRASILAACIGYQACSGVAALQERGLVVVDIKPDNLLISCGGGPEGLDSFVVKVADLGSSAPVDNSGAAYCNSVPGTMGFQSPEMMMRVDEQGRFILLHSDDGPGMGMTLALLLLRRAHVQWPESLWCSEHSTSCSHSSSSVNMTAMEFASRNGDGSSHAGLYCSDDHAYNTYCARFAADPLALHRHYSNLLRCHLGNAALDPVGAIVADIALRLMGPEEHRPTIAQARDELAQYADGWSQLMAMEDECSEEEQSRWLMEGVEFNPPVETGLASPEGQAGRSSSSMTSGISVIEPSSSSTSMQWQAELPYELYPDGELEYNAEPAYEPYPYHESHLQYDYAELPYECRSSRGSETDGGTGAVDDDAIDAGADSSCSEVCSTSLQLAFDPEPAEPLGQPLVRPGIMQWDMNTAHMPASESFSPSSAPAPHYSNACSPSAEPQPTAAAGNCKPQLMVLLPGGSPAASPTSSGCSCADLSNSSTPSSPPSTSPTPSRATCASLSPSHSPAAAFSHSSLSSHPSSPTSSLASSMGSVPPSAKLTGSTQKARVSSCCTLYECSWLASPSASAAVHQSASSPSVLVCGGRLLVLAVLLTVLAGTLACMGVVVAGVLVAGSFIMLGGCMLVMWMLAACTAGLLLLRGMHAGWACLVACCGWHLDSKQGGSRRAELQDSWAHTATRLHQYKS